MKLPQAAPKLVLAPQPVKAPTLHPQATPKMLDAAPQPLKAPELHPQATPEAPSLRLVSTQRTQKGAMEAVYAPAPVSVAKESTEQHVSQTLRTEKGAMEAVYVPEPVKVANDNARPVREQDAIGTKAVHLQAAPVVLAAAPAAAPGTASATAIAAQPAVTNIAQLQSNLDGAKQFQSLQNTQILKDIAAAQAAMKAPNATPAQIASAKLTISLAQQQQANLASHVAQAQTAITNYNKAGAAVQAQAQINKAQQPQKALLQSQLLAQTGQAKQQAAYVTKAELDQDQALQDSKANAEHIVLEKSIMGESSRAVQAEAANAGEIKVNTTAIDDHETRITANTTRISTLETDKADKSNVDTQFDAVRQDLAKKADQSHVDTQVDAVREALTNGLADKVDNAAFLASQDAQDTRLTNLENAPVPKDGKDGKDGRDGIDGAPGAAGKDGKDVDPAVAQQVTTNTKAIDTNTTQIDQNKADIAVNVLTINTNKDGVATNGKGVAKNASDIALNHDHAQVLAKGELTVGKLAVQNNKLIATNQQALSKQAQNFTALQTQVAQKVDTSVFQQRSSVVDQRFADTDARIHQQKVEQGKTNQKVADNSKKLANHEARIQDLESNNQTNFNKLQSQQNKDRKEFRAGVAGAVALTQIPQVQADQSGSFGMAVGTFNGENAIAAGVSSRLSGAVTVKSGLSWDTQGNVGAGAGVSVGW
ncbi:TPA: YadA-like family protein [Enterobacter hormaechei]|nr:YadA-like family protein [Enterobacter hormaechei]